MNLSQIQLTGEIILKKDFLGVARQLLILSEPSFFNENGESYGLINLNVYNISLNKKHTLTFEPKNFFELVNSGRSDFKYGRYVFLKVYKGHEFI